MIMILIGAFLLAVATVAIVAAVMTSGDVVPVEVFTVDLEPTTLGVFAAGAMTCLVVLAGIAALAAGVRQVQASRHEVEDLRRKVAILEGGELTAETRESEHGGHPDEPFDQQREPDRHAGMS